MCAARGLKVLLLLVMIRVLTLTPPGFVLVVPHSEWVDARIRSDKTFDEGIHLGMRREELHGPANPAYPAGGPRQKPRTIMDESHSLTFFMHPENPACAVDCEAIILNRKESKVTSQTYLPD